MKVVNAMIRGFVVPVGWMLLSGWVSHAQLVISGNENKIDLTSGAAKLVPEARGDSLTILDFATFPPKVEHIENVPNTVIGPPSNIAITPDRSVALIANSIKLDPNNATNWLPHDEIHVLDLQATPRRVIGQVQAGKQPSGMSITADGKFALVANRGEGTVTLLRISGKKVQAEGSTTICKPEESVSDVAISPDGKLALASVQKGGYLAVLRLAEGKVEFTGQKISVYGQPYRVVISPKGDFAFTAGAGFGNGLDNDAVTVIDLKADRIKAVDFVTIGASPESVEISPNGRMLAVVVMNGSNLARESPQLTKNGLLEILVLDGKRYRKTQSIKTAAIPEGVAFTSDGKKLVVQGHPARELWVYSVGREKVEDTGVRIGVPGMPSSLRASP